MTLNQIRYFVTVCQYQNFTKAAEKLHISQPGISKAMTELESECGTALFHRMHNSITLTPQGKARRRTPSLRWTRPFASA